MRLMMLIALLFAVNAQASDGVLEINAACAASSSGCFPGDAAGYPVTISQPGAYRLTGNLIVPVDTLVVDVLANGVVLDLGGFAIQGPNVCSSLPVANCTTTTGLPGIRAFQPGQFGVTVRNGTVMGMTRDGVFLGANDDTGYSMVVEDVVAVGNGGAGISVGGLSRVTRCRAHRNRLAGISLGITGSASENEAYANGGYGISMGAGLGEAVRNRLRFNVGGLLAAGAVVAQGNILSANLAGDTLPAGSVSTSDNLCNGARC